MNIANIDGTNVQGVWDCNRVGRNPAVTVQQMYSFLGQTAAQRECIICCEQMISGFNVRLPGSGHRESGHFSPFLPLPPLRTQRHVVHPDTFAPHPRSTADTTSPCWWIGLSFLWETTLMAFLEMTPIHLPNQTSAHSVFIHICKGMHVQPRDIEGIPQDLTTARSLMRVVPLHCTLPMASPALSRDSHFLCPKDELPTPDVFSTWTSSFMFSSVHLLPANTLPLGTFLQWQQH